MRVNELMQEAQRELERLGIESAMVDVQLLLGHCLNKTRTELFLLSSEEISPAILEQFTRLFSRRKNREPLAYILGEQEFWSLDFHVSSDVLIPRPETEFMLEMVLASDGQWQKEGLIVDLCTGSGVIAVVLAKELDRKVMAVDISDLALAMARKNIQRHDLSEHVTCTKSDLFSGLSKSNKISLLVSNPPYVRKNAIDHEVEPEVRDYEPHLALDGGGDDGLDLIREMWRTMHDYLAPEAEIFIEFGADQGAQIKQIFSTIYENGDHFSNIKVLQDYAGRDRVLKATFNCH